jgi:hypothetical protein
LLLARMSLRRGSLLPAPPSPCGACELPVHLQLVRHRSSAGDFGIRSVMARGPRLAVNAATACRDSLEDAGTQRTRGKLSTTEERRTQWGDSTRPACGAGPDVRSRGSENEPGANQSGSFSDPLGLTSPLRGAASKHLLPERPQRLRFSPCPLVLRGGDLLRVLTVGALHL